MFFGAATGAGVSLSTPIVAVVADLTKPGLTIPADFLGYSINPDSVIGGYLTGSSSSLINLAKMLGSSGVLRIGGLDQDTATAPALTQQIANDLYSFVSSLGAGWSLIYGLDAVANDSATAASQATMLANAFGTSKVIFQFGNEPIDGTNFTVSSYQTMWNSYYTAVVAAVPGARVAAYDDGNFGKTQTVINGLTGGVSGLAAITQHWYPFAHGSHKPEELVGSVLAQTPTVGFFLNNSWAGNTPQRLCEFNSASGGGETGLSDRMVAATWFVNVAGTFAKNGWAGLNPHNNFVTYNGIYNPLVPQSVSPSALFAPGPVFYGMYLFSKLVGQQIIPLGVFSGPANVFGIATKGGGGNANILIANNNPYASVIIQPKQSAAWSAANVLKMTGNGPSEVSPLLGGQSIGVSGTWSGSSYAIANGDTVTLGPCEAALIQINP